MADPTISHGWVTAEPDAGKDVDAPNLNDHQITGFGAAVSAIVDPAVATEAGARATADTAAIATAATDAATKANAAQAAAATDATTKVTTHSGAADPHGDRAAATSALGTHEADTTAVHGIANTANVVLTNDARLSDARTPSAHKTSHEDGGADEISLNGLAGTPAALTTHEAAADPHPGYLTPAEGNAAYDASGAAATAQSAAIAASWPTLATGLTAAAKTVLDDTTVGAMVDTLGGASATGTGGLVRATSPTLVTPALGTPASGVATNLTGTAAGLTAGGVTTNANLTGDVTSSGNATTLATVTVAKGGTNATTAAAARTNLGVSVAGISFVIDGGGATITTGAKGYVEVPFACTITAVRLQADQTGSIVVDIKKATYSGLPTTATITASAKPTLSSARKAEDATLTGWTTAVAAGDWLEYNVDSITTCQRVTVSLTVAR